MITIHDEASGKTYRIDRSMFEILLAHAKANLKYLMDLGVADHAMKVVYEHCRDMIGTLDLRVK